MKRFLIIVFCFVALTSCHKGRNYFPKDIERQEVELVRFDNALLNVHEASVAQDIRVLYDHYPIFMPLWVEDILGIPSADTAYLEKALPEFLNDTLYGFKQTNQREQEVFADVSDLEQSISKAFARIKYLYPETEIPVFYLFISGFNAPIYFNDELVTEGLHNKLYRMPDEAQMKIQETLERIINEGSGGLICIIL